MKRIAVIVAVISMLMLSATAASAKVHTGFDTDSSGCAACHITHAANAAKLLINGPSQYDFCVTCHGLAKPKGPFDVVNGAVLKAAGINYTQADLADWTNVRAKASFTGGFEKTFDFATYGDIDLDMTDVTPPLDQDKFVTSTSAHNVEGVTTGGAEWDSPNKIPGGTAKVTGNKFTCSSCHDPHGYDSGTNPRLLRKNLPARNGADAVSVNITIDTVTNNRTTGYPDATINKWCGGCHDVLDVGKNAGNSKVNPDLSTDTRYRHAMGITVATAGPALNTSLSTGLPLASGDKLICISCHRVHGTAADTTGFANSWDAQDYDNPGNANTTRTGSVLLRQDKRDVCWNCHKDAIYNLNSTPNDDRLAPAY